MATGRIRIKLRGGKAAGGVQKLTVKKGDPVTIVVQSDDVSGEVHLHGYDLMKDVSPGRSVTFRFPAKIEGVFEAELEDTHTKILSLSVEP